MNRKLLAVIRREYLQMVQARAFWISTLLIPTLGLGFLGVQIALQKTLVPAGRIAVVDLTGRLLEPLQAELKSAREESTRRRGPQKIELVPTEATPDSLPAARKKLNEEVQAKRLKAYVILDSKTLETGVAEWRAISVKSEFVMKDVVSDMLSRAITNVRLRDRGVDPAIYADAKKTAKLDVHEAADVEKEGSKDVGINLVVSAILFMLIYVSILLYGTYIMRGVMEEKNNRIVEVLVSSVRPNHLMLGKIIGIGCVGLTQYAIWATITMIASAPGVVVALGMADSVPSIPLVTMVAFVVFFILGYFLYASLYAALAAPFNTEQEAQQFIMIPIMVLVLTTMTMMFTYNSPDGPLATALSFFPFSSPLVMFMRISVQPPPAWQIALSVLILVATIVGIAWVAGRIYRVGILMYGKRPTLPEIFRWARQAD